MFFDSLFLLPVNLFANSLSFSPYHLFQFCLPYCCPLAIQPGLLYLKSLIKLLCLLYFNIFAVLQTPVWSPIFPPNENVIIYMDTNCQTDFFSLIYCLAITPQTALKNIHVIFLKAYVLILDHRLTPLAKYNGNTLISGTDKQSKIWSNTRLKSNRFISNHKLSERRSFLK